MITIISDEHYINSSFDRSFDQQHNSRPVRSTRRDESPNDRQTNELRWREGRSPTKNDRGIHAPAVRTASLMTDHSINSLFVRPATQLSFERRAAALRCVASEVEERTNIVSYRIVSESYRNRQCPSNSGVAFRRIRRYYLDAAGLPHRNAIQFRIVRLFRCSSLDIIFVGRAAVLVLSFPLVAALLLDRYSAYHTHRFVWCHTPDACEDC